GEGGGEGVEPGGRRLGLGERTVDRAAGAAGQREEAAGVGGDLVPGRAGAALRVAHSPRGEDAREPGPAFAVEREEDEAARSLLVARVRLGERDADFGADDD